MNEIWKDIKGYEGFYQISSLGRIKSLDRKVNHPHSGYLTLKSKFLKPSMDKDGYKKILLTKNGKYKNFRISRLVGLNFIPIIKNKNIINHINGIKADDNINNLEWCTISENCLHAFKINNRKMDGINHPQHKLNPSHIRRIRWIRDNIKVEYGYWSKLARSLNVSPMNICDILKNRSWKNLV